jgi:ABC-2 type transport system ATP-binding protein
MNNPIELEDLRVEFPTRRSQSPVVALAGVTLAVQRGTIYGFLGPNGAGKTTTMHTLLGFIPPTAGFVRVLDGLMSARAIRRRVGYLSEHPELYPYLTGRELLLCMGQLFGIARVTLVRRAGALLERVGLAAAAHRRLGTYSRGMLQRIGLAQALINDPDLIILDEPTSGLDPLGRMDFRKIILELRQAGKTIFFSSHELSEVERVCDHIAILAAGRIVAEGPADRLTAPDENLEQFFLRMVSPPEVRP